MNLFKRSLFLVSFPLCSVATLVSVTTASAQQVVPDNTLGSENSVVNPNVDIKGSPGDSIEGGATRGSSLFHSFEKFDVNSNGRVYFNPQSNIQNIFSRVTGGNPSNIQGTLGVLNSANLFFINPNGILFGPNAKLDVNGSFLGSTANSLLFGNQFEFGATSKLAPPELLTVNIPTGLRFRDNPVSTANPVNITVQSYSEDVNGNSIGLEVPDGKSIALVGSDVLVDYGRLVARSGRIELGGVRGTGEIGLDGNTLQLNFPDNVTRADVRLKNYGEVIVRGSGGGNIAIKAKDIEISDNSLVQGGISLSPTVATGAQAGDVTLNATGAIEISGEAQISASTFARGNAGNIIVRAENGTVSLSNSDIFSNIEAGGDGKGGVIDIIAKSVSLSSGTQLQTLVREAEDGLPAGRGEAGSVNLRAENDISIAGSNTRIFSSIETGGEGKGGNVSITVDKGSLTMNDGARIVASTAGKGDAGNITVQAKNGTVALSNSDIFSSVNTGGEGKGGNVSITVDKGSFNMNDGAQISASTFGKGNTGNVTVRAENGSVFLTGSGTTIFNNIGARSEGQGGVIDITAKSVSLSSGAQLQTLVGQAETGRPVGRGEAGSVNLRAEDDISLTGSGTRIYSDLETGREGKGGNVSITVDKGSFNMNDGARIIASTAGKGDAGNVTVRAENGAVTLSNGDIFSNIEVGGEGKGGVIDITAKSLSLSSGAQLQTLVRRVETGRSVGQGEAGDVIVRAENGISLTGDSTRIFSSLGAGREGKGGNVSITVDKGSFNMNDGARIIANTAGKGDAGNITVQTKNGTVALSNSDIFSNVETGGEGKGGNVSITVNKGSFSMNDGAQISASTFGKGNTGNVTVQAENGSVFLTGSGTTIFNNIEAGGEGEGGVIDITAKSLSLSSGAQLQTLLRKADIEKNLSGGIGKAGDVNITVRGGDLTLAGKGANPSLISSAVESGATGNGGNINLTVENGSFYVRDGAQLDASAFGKGEAGNVNLRADSVLLSGEKTLISANTNRQGEAGGTITINAKIFEATNGGRVTTFTGGNGKAGNIIFRVSDRILISGSNSGVFSNTEENSQGAGGSIDIDPKEMILRDGATISVDSKGSGNGGSIKIGAGILRLDNATITAETQSAQGGSIEMNLQDLLILRRGSKISATAGRAQRSGDGGDITINIPDGVIIAFPQENSDITANAFNGRGGNIFIRGALLGIAPLTRQQLQQLDPVELDPNNISTSDITAISQQQPQQQGSVQLNTEIDPNRGLVELPEEVTDPSKEIAQNPCQRGVESRFVVTGRGGLPTSPAQTVNSSNVQVDLVEPAIATQNSANTNRTTLSSTSSNPKQFVPAQGWVSNGKGEVVLTAYDPASTGAQRPLRTLTPTSCAIR